jgi:hypothetical protein
VDWGPYQNEPSKPIEEFRRGGESLREETPVGDRRRGASDRMAFDAQDDRATFRAMFGAGAASIETRGR